MSHLEQARQKLAANNLEAGLPTRENHFHEVYNFLFERLRIRHTQEAKRTKAASGQVANIKARHQNKTMFVCGVPGTGKTATTLKVIEKLATNLDSDPCPIHSFRHIYINGQHLSKPDKVYSEILYKITGQSLSSERAQDKLDQLFKQPHTPTVKTSKVSKVSASKSKLRSSSTQKSYKEDDCPKYTIVVLDELDLLYSVKRQSVFYSLFDWPTTTESTLILIAIANAMDLPERFMRGRVTSRLGWNKLVFESYTSECLEKILTVRLGTQLLSKSFEKGAILFATKQIARTTGDARRILDTCRLAIDLAIEQGLQKVTVSLVSKVGFQNMDLRRANYVSNCTLFELMTLKCILGEAARVGEDNIDAWGVYVQFLHMIDKQPLFKGMLVGSGEFTNILYSLAAVSMITLEAEKPFLKKRLYMKQCSESVKDLINNRTIQA